MSIADSTQFDALLADVDVASVVAEHKSCFFIEKDRGGNSIDYGHAVSGGLCIVPTDAARDALAKDCAAMIEDNVLVGDEVTFDELMAKCASIHDTLNRIMASNNASGAVINFVFEA